MTIRRILCVPLNYSHKQRGMLGAFREVFGADNVREFDFMEASRNGRDANKLLLEAALKFNPDWIWLQLQDSGIITSSTIEKLRRKLKSCLITHWTGDVRANTGILDLDVSKNLLKICQATHATLISSVGQIGIYRQTGAPRIEYVQVGLDWDEDVLGLPPWEPPFRVPDVVFCANHYGHVPSFERGTRERLEAITSLAKAGLDVGIVGNGWPTGCPVVGTCHVKQQHHVYKRAKVALSISHFCDIDRYYSDRQLIAMASGTPTVCYYVPGLEHEFADQLDCLFYSPVDGRSVVDRVKWALDHTDQAAKIGAAGQSKVVKDHTWTARIRTLVSKANAWKERLN